MIALLALMGTLLSLSAQSLTVTPASATDTSHFSGIYGLWALITVGLAGPAGADGKVR